MTTVTRTRNSGFSLIELVIVVVIIAIIGAIAIPRMSRGAAGASDAALVGNLAVLRNAIDLYATEHGGSFPAVGTFTAQMTLFSDTNGVTAANKTATAIYGPYLRKIPTLPVGVNKNSSGIADGSSATIGAAGAAWYYNATTGQVQANCPDTEIDASGKQYNSY